jgi:hypothetical protein
MPGGKDDVLTIHCNPDRRDMWPTIFPYGGKMRRQGVIIEKSIHIGSCHLLHSFFAPL